MPTISVIKGDITEVDCEAIVNPANSLLIMGGGVAGAIKRKGGDVIEKEATKFAPCPIGKAILTTAGTLPAKYVIHAPTMERPAMRTTIEKVEKAIMASLELAEENKINCIAFPGMGTGVGGLSAQQAGKAFINAFRSFFLGRAPRWVKKVILVAFTDDLYNVFIEIKKQIEKEIEKVN